ncbi:AraC family transcriptional regulator [Paroceanicella profunda]|uniref:AraC family transcriptional regulator n=2 Tax=Paroceanicella profunda TaxID=2579971 RepID=A0A5B8FXU2_9RHOB|nr:AraC family transcriptional regulator [Paroceanicella profunda]
MIPIQSSELRACDPLSDMLALLDVRSFLSRRIEASGPWALRFPAYRHMKFGGVIEGTRWLWTESGAGMLELEAGDFYLLTDGGPYCFASDRDAVPMDGLGVMDRHLQADGVVRFGSGAPRSVGVGGRFVLDDETSGLLLSMLPPLLHIRGSDPQAGALRAALALITHETETRRPGTAAIGSGICAIILVNILRLHLAGGERPSGWLGALNDRRVGAAIRAMHCDLARRWRVAELAAAVGMSRTAFADRFRRLVGLAPLEYLIHWRMMKAREALKRERAPLADIAAAIGYESETAFSLAFKRKFGESPGRYRKRQQQVVAPQVD